MENNMHKGTEFNNIIETWNKNEQNRNSGNVPGNEGAANEEITPAANPLEEVIRQEAAAYDSEIKENQLLGGDRATVNDETVDAGDSGE